MQISGPGNNPEPTVVGTRHPSANLPLPENPMDLVILLLIVAPLAFVGIAISRPALHARWGKRIATDTTTGPTPYRAHRRITAADHREPRLVRATSLLTALLGGMIIPGIPAALAGILIVLVGLGKLGRAQSATDVVLFLVALSAPSGLVIAARCLRLYGPMLKNEPGIAGQMRGLAWHSGIHNGLLLAVYTIHAANGAALGEVVWGLYSVVSLLHVALLVASSRTIEHRRRAHADYLEAVGTAG